MTKPRTGATLDLGDRIVVAPDVVATVHDIDPNDGHLYLVTVREWPTLLAIGKLQVVDIEAATL